MTSAASAADSQAPEQCQLANDAYTVGWICALPTEYVTAQVFLDEEHMPPILTATHDNNNYTLGRIGKHNVAIGVLPGGEYGTASAASVARDMLHTFPNIRIGLMVGIGGGAPTMKHDIRLGDVVVSKPRNGQGGVFQYDFGKSIQDQPFQSTRFLAPPPPVLLTAISGLMAKYEKDGHSIQEDIKICLTARKRLQKKYSRPDAATDRLYHTNIVHPLSEAPCPSSCGSDAPSVIVRPARDEDDDDPVIHYGLIASANQMMKDAKLRDEFAHEKEVLCFEMEAGGLMNHFPCLVIRGICDYSDTHKNKEWQGYAAMTAAAYTKDLLKQITPNKVEAEKRISDRVENVLAVSIDTKTRVQSIQTSAHFEKLSKWLSAPDPSTNLNKARELHQPGTGLWLLESNKYKSWKTDPGSFMWLHGIPGCGKTILSSTIVADLKKDPMTSLNLLYFYFNFTDVEKRSTEKAVRSLIDQVYRQNTATQEVVDTLYTTHEKGKSQPTCLLLQKVLQTIISKLHDVWIILDGLDECETRGETASDSVMLWVKQLRRSLPNVHVLITSRPEEDIKSCIESWASDEVMVSLQSNLVADDISAYIHKKVEQMARWQTEPEIQTLIWTTLNKRANGMFRWVACQFDALERCLSRKDVLRELAALPHTLDETYARIYERICPEYKPSAIRLLQLLTYSPRPLRIEEAVDAITVDPENSPRFDKRNRMKFPKEITRYCSSFVTLTTNYNVGMKAEVTKIQLAHFSVQEYFQSNRLQPDLAVQLSKTAVAAALVDLFLSYLIELDISLSMDEIKEQYPFAEFSAQYWSDFAAIQEASSQQVSKAIKEYYTCHDAFILGYTLYRPDCPGWQRNCREVSPLYYASFTGLSASVKVLLEAEANTNIQCGYYGNALQAASYRGHEGIVQILIQHHADVNAQGGYYGNALQAASEEGHKGVVEMLVRHGADVNARGGGHGNALYAASENGHDGIVQILAQHGAIINARGGRYGNALQAASYRGHDSIVQILIQHHADVNAEGGYYGSAIYNASYSGHDGIVQKLIQHHADVNAEGGYYGNALQAASYRGHGGIVQILIQHGADVNARGGRYGNALRAALEGGHRSITQRLIENGADVNTLNGTYDDILYHASSGGHIKIVQRVIQRGADVNVRGPHYGSALQGASTEGYQDVVQMLIQHGADVNAQGGGYGNALQAASFRGHACIVQLLIQSGAHVNMQGGPYGNALYAASRAGHGEVVSILLQNGANVGVWAARAAASSRGHEGIAKQLRVYYAVK